MNMAFTREFVLLTLLPAFALLGQLAALPSTSVASEDANKKPLAVILDTDIGDDIDDTWALGLLLKSPELDVKLVVGDYGKAEYRAKLLAKLLQAAGRTDIPVGMGLRLNPDAQGPQAEWVKDYDLKSYPGKIHEDGVQAIIDTILGSQEPITLIAIGPLPNIAAALEREPRIAQRARFVGMHGSVRLGYGGSSTPAAEWNVRADPKSCAKVFTAPWEMTITPLDTCGLIQLRGEKYKALRGSPDPIARTLMENYRLWCGKDPGRADRESSTLFDTVAVYLAFSRDLCVMERLGVSVKDDGFTVIDEKAKAMDCAMEWKDLGAFEDLLVKRIGGVEASPSAK